MQMVVYTHLIQSIWVLSSLFVHALSNEAGAGQFMTDFLPLTAWSQVPPVSLSVSSCGTAVTIISLFLLS